MSASQKVLPWVFPADVMEVMRSEKLKGQKAKAAQSTCPCSMGSVTRGEIQQSGDSADAYFRPQHAHHLHTYPPSHSNILSLHLWVKTLFSRPGTKTPWWGFLMFLQPGMPWKVTVAMVPLQFTIQLSMPIAQSKFFCLAWKLCDLNTSQEIRKTSGSVDFLKELGLIVFV